MFSEARPTPLLTESFPCLSLDPSRDDLLRRLSSPSVCSRPLPEPVERAIEQGRSWLAPCGTFSVYSVDRQTPRSLSLGSATITGQIGGFLDGATRVAAFVVTVGDEISLRARAAARSGDAVAGWALDTLGSWAAEAAVRSLLLRLDASLAPGEAQSLRYSPGYCGMGLSLQRLIFRLVRAKEVGVTLLPSMLMHPLKSVSGVVGIGPAHSMSQRSPCETCKDLDCPMRRR